MRSRASRADGGEQHATRNTHDRLSGCARGEGTAPEPRQPRSTRNDLIGRRIGDDIVQPAWYGDLAIKWMFSRVTPESVLWQGFELEPDGSTWKLVTEFNLTRTR